MLLSDVNVGRARTYTSSPLWTCVKKSTVSTHAVTTLVRQYLTAHTPAALSISFAMTPPATAADGANRTQSDGSMT